MKIDRVKLGHVKLAGCKNKTPECLERCDVNTSCADFRADEE